VNSILDDVVPTPSGDEGGDFEKLKRGLQSAALRAIKAAVRPPATERMRYKLERWRSIHFGLTGLPGHFAPMIVRRITKLGKLVNPRVHAATFSTMWNRWYTHRRRQKSRDASNKCVFKCGGDAEDSIEHYCKCPIVHRVAMHVMHFDYPNESALNIWMLNSSWHDDDTNLKGIGLLVYGCYMAFNTIRHNGITCGEQAFHCITQHCKQGAMGHSACMKYLDEAWQRPMNHVC
jgi:hypothetical protein